MTVDQIAYWFCVDTSTVRKWVQRRHVTRNQWKRIDPAQVLAYLDSRGGRGVPRHAQRLPHA